MSTNLLRIKEKKSMYINLFICGIVATLLFEVSILFIVSIVNVRRDRKRKREIKKALKECFSDDKASV